MSNDSIYMDYRNALAQADKLDELAAMLRRTASASADRAKADLSGGWRSEVKDMCLHRSDLLAVRIGAHASELEVSANLLRIAVSKHRAAETLAQIIFGA